MEVGKLFVSLGIKGSEKTVGAITNVKKGLNETASSALLAKAAIIGAVYALEQLFSKSNSIGTSLKNFTTLTGISNEALQRFGYVAKETGGNVDQMAEAFKGMQDAMFSLKYEGQSSPFFDLFAKQMHLGSKDIDNFIEHPEKLLYQVQEFARKSGFSKPLINKLTAGMHIAPEIVAGMQEGNFTPAKIDAVPRSMIYSQNQIEALDKNREAWSRLWDQVGKTVGDFNAAHGGQFVGDVGKIVNSLLDLAKAMIKFSESVGLFDKLTSAINGLAHSIDYVVSVLSGKEDVKLFGPLAPGFTEAFKGAKEGSSSLKDKAGKFLDDNANNEFLKGFMSLMMSFGTLLNNNVYGTTGPTTGGQGATPKPPPIPPQGNNNINNNVNQYFQGTPDDPRPVGKAAGDGIKTAMFQSNARVRIS